MEESREEKDETKYPSPLPLKIENRKLKTSNLPNPLTAHLETSLSFCHFVYFVYFVVPTYPLTRDPRKPKTENRKLKTIFS